MSVASLIAIPLLVWGLAACSSPPSEEDAGKSDGKSAGAEMTSEQWQVEFAACMREEGIDMPDPKNGQVTSSTTNDPEAMKAASQTCLEKLGDPPAPTAEEQQKGAEEFEKVIEETVECYRDKGYDVADPAPGEAPNIPKDVPADVVDECGGQIASRETGK